jgi:hypothetical protein
MAERTPDQERRRIPWRAREADTAFENASMPMHNDPHQIIITIEPS